MRVLCFFMSANFKSCWGLALYRRAEMSSLLILYSQCCFRAYRKISFMFL